MLLSLKVSILGGMISALKSIRIGVFLSFVNLLIQGTAFLVQNGIVRNLGNANYGYFGILQSDLLIFSSLGDFGIATLIIAFFAKKATTGKLFLNIFQLRFLSSVAAATAMLIFALVARKNHAIFYGELILIPSLVFQHAFFDWYFTCGAFWKKLLISKILHTISYATVMTVALAILKIDSIEWISFCMVIAALPAWAFGVTNAFTRKLLNISKRTFKFIGLMYKAALPYALASIASFMYLPLGLYFVDHFAPAEFLSAYNYSNKLIALASGFMVHFISSSLLSLHQANDGKVHIKDQGIFTIFITICSLPFFVFPEWILKILFFAAPWDSNTLAISCMALRILSASLILQAIRMPYISLLLKEKQVWKYVIFISIGGIINFASCYLALNFYGPKWTPLAVLAGDVSLTLFLAADAIKSKKYA